MGRIVRRFGSAGTERREINLFERILICVYFLLSFFEPYLNGTIGSVTKYYIFFLMLVLLINHPQMKLKSYHWCFLVWLAYKFITMLWASNTYIFSLHVLSQIGMVALLVIITSFPMDAATINGIVSSMWLGSFAIGFLSLFMSHAYHGEVVERQVLYLFGQEADPNNQAAFILVGIAIAAYYIVNRRHILFSAVTIAVNAFSMFLTGSRGGLVGLICIVLALVVFLFGSMKRGGRLWMLAILAAGCVTVYYLVKRYLPEDIGMRLFDFSSYEGGSNRTYLWRNGWELFTTGLNTVFGAGWGSYFSYNSIFEPMHNTFLSMLCDVGILGCLVFFIPIAKASLAVIRERLYLPVLILISGFVPSFFIDAVNKRFFWNGIILVFIYFVSMNNVKSTVGRGKEADETNIDHK